MSVNRRTPEGTSFSFGTLGKSLNNRAVWNKPATTGLKKMYNGEISLGDYLLERNPRLASTSALYSDYTDGGGNRHRQYSTLQSDEALQESSSYTSEDPELIDVSKAIIVSTKKKDHFNRSKRMSRRRRNVYEFYDHFDKQGFSAVAIVPGDHSKKYYGIKKEDLEKMNRVFKNQFYDSLRSEMLQHSSFEPVPKQLSAVVQPNINPMSPINGALDVVTSTTKLLWHIVTWGEIANSVDRLWNDLTKPIKITGELVEYYILGEKIRVQGEPIPIKEVSMPLYGDGPNRPPPKIPAYQTHPPYTNYSAPQKKESSSKKVSKEKEKIKAKGKNPFKEMLEPSQLEPEENSSRLYWEPASEFDRQDSLEPKYTWDPNTDIPNLFQRRALEALKFGVDQALKKELPNSYTISKEVHGLWSELYLNYLPKLKEQKPDLYEDVLITRQVNTFGNLARFLNYIYGPDGPIDRCVEAGKQGEKLLEENFPEFGARGLKTYVNLIPPHVARDLGERLNPLFAEGSTYRDALDESTYEKLFGKKKSISIQVVE